MVKNHEINAWEVMDRHMSGCKVLDEEIAALVDNMAVGSKEEMITYCLLHSLEKKSFAETNPGKKLSYAKSFKAINTRHQIKQKIDYFRKLIKAGEVSRILGFKIGTHLEYTLRPLADLYTVIPDKALKECWNDILTTRKGRTIKNAHVAKAAERISKEFPKKQRQLSAKMAKKKKRAARLKKINKILKAHPILIKATLDRLRIDAENLLNKPPILQIKTNFLGAHNADH